MKKQSIFGKKENLLTKQEPERTYNIDLRDFFQKVSTQMTIGQTAKSNFPNKQIS